MSEAETTPTLNGLYWPSEGPSGCFVGRTEHHEYAIIQ